MDDKQYLTYEEYKAMGGLLPESTFIRYEFKARKEIDKLTSGRLIALTEQVKSVKMCVYELIRYILIEDEQKNKISESANGYSASFEKKEDIKISKEGIIMTYLSEETLEDGTPYLYRGF